ncbi:hypothetical protein [Aliivibrio finisterrensis]|uniref:Uncharacterized protein n=1 Tax=Aliivibrio finisterrensis TaxID=511998 RepID=A0ABY0I4U7_9GAMM|nr:hypothetical protein [Aliivibrio finisterrensis]RYU63806.1 hypothetical protein ERW53_12250 [Aliivibrio finisterrensis]RYU82743.1 hypothetical protein ERW52_14075 [Aliivibrio finisterrensis]
MSDEENPLSSGKKASKKNNLASIAVILAVLSLLVGIGGAVYNNMNSEAQNKRILIAVNQMFSENDSQPEFNAEQINAISIAVLDTLRPELPELVSGNVSNTFDHKFDSLVEATATAVIRNLPAQPATETGLTEIQVKQIIDTAFKDRSARINVLIGTKLKELDEIKEQHQLGIKELNKAQKHMTQIKSQIAQSNGDTTVIIERQRLKEFKLISTLKNSTLFVVDAPKRDGKDNTITLTIGERFFSKFGRHKVEKLIYIDKKPRLLISGGWFIDDVREELSEEEIKLYAEKIAARKSTKNKQKKKVAPENKIVELRVAKTQEKEKIYLNSWKIITPIKEQQRVVALDEKTNKLVHLKMNQYVSGLGTVRNIDYQTGETCTEKYCIAGVKFK